MALFGAALGGVAAALGAPRRYGRRGSHAVLGGVVVLLVRDAAMVSRGAPGRLRTLPRVLLYLELASAASAAALSVVALLRPAGDAPAPDGRRAPAAPALAAAASGTAALTFLVHAVRQAIYLSPRRGRRDPATGREG